VSVPLTPAEQWREIDAIALETFDGNVQLADGYDLALQLLAGADPSAGTWDKDGTRVFELLESEEFGAAKLHVRPGAEAEFGGFLITTTTHSTLGFEGDLEGTAGSKLELRMGIEGDSLTSFGSWAEVQFDGDEHPAHLGRGELRRGAFLMVDATEVNWRPQTLRVDHDEQGALRGTYLFGEPRSILVGELSDGRARELAARLGEFRIP
jgi:hypothetical protein